MFWNQDFDVQLTRPPPHENYIYATGGRGGGRIIMSSIEINLSSAYDSGAELKTVDAINKAIGRGLYYGGCKHRLPMLYDELADWNSVV